MKLAVQIKGNREDMINMLKIIEEGIKDGKNRGFGWVFLEDELGVAV